MIWCFAGSAITKLAVVSLGASLLHGPLDTPNTWAVGHSSFIPPAATRLSYAASLTRLPYALRLPGKGVVVDLERWRFTPRSEQRNPVQTYKQAYYQARRVGKWIMATPAMDLFGHGNLPKKYLHSRIAARIAPLAGAYDIQAQGLERNPARYAQFVHKVSFQLRRANPHIVILAGISTNPGGAPVTLQELKADYQATHTAVNGYWLNIPPGTDCPNCHPPRTILAVRFLRSAIG